MKRLNSSKKGDMTIGKVVAIVLALAIILVSIFILMDKGKIFAKAGKFIDKECADCSFGNKCKNPCPEEKPKIGLTPCERTDKTEGHCCIGFG